MTTITKLVGQYKSSELKHSSNLLILAQLINAGGLFLFWIINARLFSADIVGLATAFVSFGVLTATFTNLGLPNTIIRFLPKSKYRGGLFTASFMLVALASLIGGLVALIVARHYVGKLEFVTGELGLELLMVLLVMSTAISALLDGTLVSLHKGKLILAKSIITNLPRLVLPFVVVGAGLRGITAVYVGSLLVGIGYNSLMIIGRLLAEHSLRPNITQVTKHRAYAVSNYFGGMFGVLPVTVAPLVVLAKLGPASAAYFYMPMMIAALMSLICNSISQALIADCSQTDDVASHRALFHRAFKHQYKLLIPLIVGLMIAGWPILSIYGSEYAVNGYVPLLVLLLSGLLVGLNWLGDTWLNIQKRSRDYFLMNAFNAVAVVSFVWLFAGHGLVAVSLGWMCGQLLSASVYLLVFARSQLLNFVIKK